MGGDEMVVLVNESRVSQVGKYWGKTAMSVETWPSTIDEARALLDELFERGAKWFAVAGGDDLLGQVITAYWRTPSLGAYPLELWPLDIEEPYVVAHLDQAISPARAARMMEKKSLQWQRKKVATLKVTASTEPAAWYGFSFGAGWIYRALQARQRARGGVGNLVAAIGKLATQTVGDDDNSPVALRLAVDHRPIDEPGGSLVATTLRQTYFGLGTEADTPMLWDQLSAARLMRHAVTPELLQATNRRARPFESVHLDSPPGWMLDGRLHEGTASAVIQVAPGPTVTLVHPRSRLASRVRRVLRFR